MSEPGQVVILNGAPRSGKSSIVAVIQERFDGVWMNLGVDVFARHGTPPRLQPGIGLRPGGERPDIEELVPALFAAMYNSVAAHSRQGLNVVVDVGHHDAYARPRHTLQLASRAMQGLPVLFVGVRCPLDTIMHRRDAPSRDRPGAYLGTQPDGTPPEPVLRWQREVHLPGRYDLEVDTSRLSPQACADAIRERLPSQPGSSVLHQLS